MKKMLPILALTLLGSSFAMPATQADDSHMDAIKARQGEFRMRAFYMGTLGAMAKGDMPYDAEKAQTMADNLLKLTELENGAMWVKGTDSDSYPGKSGAKPEIWSTYPKIMDAGKQYKMAVVGLAKEAGKGLKPMRSKVGAVGKACKGCHEDFRKKL